MITRATYDALAWGVGLAGVLTFVALWFVVAPYGRHVRKGWGPTLPDRWGWALMESPSLLLFAALFFSGAKHDQIAPLALWAMWTAHYVHRTLVYPLRMKTTGKRMPIVIVLLALVFNVTNATMNACWISQLGDYPRGWIVGAPFISGALLFGAGMALNLDSDARLLSLRAPGETAYKIPRGGLFEWVSCPNYLAEIAEWTGWALASWSIGGAAFAFYTVANLAPRAAAHHVWYRRTFRDYPAERRALVPFVW
jgi:protein-S-isoprenylcysteine O-methyltransferase Ste14